MPIFGQKQGQERFQFAVHSDNPAVELYRAAEVERLTETRAPKAAELGVPPVYCMGILL